LLLIQNVYAITSSDVTYNHDGTNESLTKTLDDLYRGLNTYKTGGNVEANQMLKGATGYVVKLSNSNKFKKVKTKKVKKTNCVIKNIKVSKKYYIKARAYKKVGGKNYYGVWSKIKRK